jgi:phage shock protein PspC (stress-responsive transcriptional regulator)
VTDNHNLPDPSEELPPPVDFGSPPPTPAVPVPAEPVPERPVVLRRCQTGRVIGGVACGIGRWLGIDVLWVRIIFLVLLFGGGSGLLLYIIGWIAIPEETGGEPVGVSPHASSYRTQVFIGGALVVLGSWLLITRLFPQISGFIGPIVVIAFGLMLLLGGRGR